MNDPVFTAYPAPAKLNLNLLITGKREDGYHLLDSDFRLIDLADMVELAVREDGQVVLHNPIPDVPAEQDLTVRAARLLQPYARLAAAGVDIRLSKRIPMGGGLGGGSSDAATVLMALNRLWACNLAREQLMQLGEQLGADVPFFIFGRNARVQGIGEKMTAIDLPASWYVVLHPTVHVPTVKVFKEFSQKVLTGELAYSTMRTLSTTTQTQNDLQSVVERMYPAVSKALNSLKSWGSPLMTGSGACVFLECSTECEAKTVYQSLSSEFVGFVTRGLLLHPMFDEAGC